jgi:cytochrome b561
MALILLRLMHRRREKWQSAARNTPQYNLVNKAHQLLLFASVAMPVTGLLLSGLSGHGVALFGLSLIPSNYLDNTAVPFSELGYVFASWLHTIVGYAFFILVIGHILAALKHHFISKDNTLKRMLSGRYN